MVIINTDPWKSDEDDPIHSEASSLGLFGFQDLANDYYQVLSQRSRKSIFKLVWGAVVMVLMGVTFYMIYELLNDYLQYNSYNHVKTEWKDKVTLPAISICSTNPINYTLLTNVMSQDSYTDGIRTKLDDFLEELENFKGGGYNYVRDTVNLTDFESMVDFEIHEYSFVRPDKFRTNISKMLLGSSNSYFFENVEQVIEDFDKVAFPNQLGSCLELNDDGALVQSIGGVAGGFTIDLNAHIRDYLPTTATNGFVVYIRDQDETIMMDRGGLVISPGTETFIRLNKKSVTRLREPHGTCKNIESRFNKYETHDHIRECIEQQIIDGFSVNLCIPWFAAERAYTLNKTDLLDEYYEALRCGELYEYYLPDLCNETENSARKRRSLDSLNILKSIRRPKRDYDSTWSTPTSSTPTSTMITPNNASVYDTKYAPYICGFVLQKTYMIYLQKGHEKFDGCPEPCAFNEWEVDMSTTFFPPTEKYYKKFLQNKTGNATFQDARENLARIHIYYDDLKVSVIEQVPSYEIQNFIAELGGTVDLFIGFSFFTVLQLIEIAIAACVKRCRRKAKEENKAQFATATPPAATPPAATPPAATPPAALLTPTTDLNMASQSSSDVVLELLPVVDKVTGAEPVKP